MAAQHQHYVPKLLLKGFFSLEPKERAKQQVRVLDLLQGREYLTSIDNIMGERRYNDFWIDEDTLATVEPACGRIESHVAPLVERIREERRLTRTPEELADLALLMAFQFLRTKRMRLLPERIDRQIRAKVSGMGLDPSKVDGLVDWDEEMLKAFHTKHQMDGIEKYSKIIAEKEFLLMTAPEGSSFYLSDHPVALHNDQTSGGLTSGLGLSVPYIQIYLPLSSKVLLCAYCPSVLGNLMRSRDEDAAAANGSLLRALMDGKITGARMREIIEQSKKHDLITPWIEAIRAGQPLAIGPEQVQYYNSLQAFQAHRFVVDPDGKFQVAREMMTEREAADRAEASPDGFETCAS